MSLPPWRARGSLHRRLLRKCTSLRNDLRSAFASRGTDASVTTISSLNYVMIGNVGASSKLRIQLGCCLLFEGNASLSSSQQTKRALRSGTSRDSIVQPRPLILPMYTRASFSKNYNYNLSLQVTDSNTPSVGRPPLDMCRAKCLVIR